MRAVADEPDRYEGTFVVSELGHWDFGVEAWTDPFALWQDELRRKQQAGQADLSVELSEGELIAGQSIATADAARGARGRAPRGPHPAGAHLRDRRRPAARRGSGRGTSCFPARSAG